MTVSRFNEAVKTTKKEIRVCPMDTIGTVTPYLQVQYNFIFYQQVSDDLPMYGMNAN